MTPTLPTMPSTDDQDVNQDLNAGLQNTPANTTPDAPMISPDFSDTRVVPFAQQKAATDAGWQPATKMAHPTTQDKRWVPNTQVPDAQKAGYVSLLPHRPSPLHLHQANRSKVWVLRP